MSHLKYTESFAYRWACLNENEREECFARPFGPESIATPYLARNVLSECRKALQKTKYLAPFAQPKKNVC